MRAAEGNREVLDFRERLDELDRALDEELRRKSAGTPRATVREALGAAGEIASLPALWGLGKLADLVSRWDRLNSTERADEFGLDPEFEDLVAPLFLFLYRRWFRVEVEGIDAVPESGPALLVANHSGAMFPYDGAMLKVALRVDHAAVRELRPLVDDFVFQLPFVGSLMARLGGVRACPANGERLLRRGEAVSVFPEGLRGMQKPFRERYRLQRFGRGGFVSLALRTGAPIVPIAIVGAEEIHPLLGTLSWPAKLVGLPYLPLTPTFPWLGVLGLVPLPSKWRIRFGAPIDLGRRHGGADPEDRALVDRATEDVRERIQDMLDDMVRERRSVFG